MQSHAHSARVPQTTGELIRSATLYDWITPILTFGTIARIRRAMLDHTELSSLNTVLDSGCGVGDLCLMLKSRLAAASTVIGIDASPEMIAYAQRKVTQACLDIPVQLQVAERLAFAEHTFDGVFSSLVLHHVPNTTKRDVLKEAWRVLRPHGCLVVMDFVAPNPWWSRTLTRLWLHDPQTLLTTNQLKTLIHEAGFATIKETSMVWGIFAIFTAVKR